MVQRRMDDAMLFHVAIHEETNQPIALIWLYLAETQAGKIVLIANFFEVNARYAHDEITRKSLLNGLLAFTNQYLEANPNIAGFYMNQLTYGWNVGDLNQYPKGKLKLKDKLGGAFDVDGICDSDTDSMEFTKSQYYLASLGRKRFHVFKPEILLEECKVLGLSTTATSAGQVSVEKDIQPSCASFQPAFFSNCKQSDLVEQGPCLGLQIGGIS